LASFKLQISNFKLLSLHFIFHQNIILTNLYIISMTKLVFNLTVILTSLLNFVYATTIQSNQTGNWNTTTTWVGSVIPSINDDVVIAVGHTITIDANVITGINECKSLTVNGKLIYNSAVNFNVGEFSNRTAACLVNGTLECTVGYGFKIYGYLKFGMGSIFRMYSGGMLIDGTLGTLTSVAAGQAHLDVTDIGTLDVYRSTITIRNPHRDPLTPCIKGAKRFGNNIDFGGGSTPDVGTDFLVSETAKPEFSFLEVNITNSISRFKATNITIDSGLGLKNGGLYNYSSVTPIYVKVDVNVSPNATITGDIEFNGVIQQNINPQDGATSVIFNGNLIVNNPTEVKTKMDVTIQGGDLKLTQGRFDTQSKTLTLERPPLNSSDTRYIVTYNFYHDIGFLAIKNLTGNTLFPIGTTASYAPVTLYATSGNFKASVTPTQTAAPAGLGYSTVNLEWNVQRLTGSATANITFQWNSSDETAGFTTYRSNCELSRYNGTAWQFVTVVGGANTVLTGYTKGVANLNTFGAFTLYTASTAVLPVELTQFTGKKVGQQALLSWTTASEKDNQGFEIEKNTEGGVFETIGFVKSKGNSNASTDYTFWDNNFSKTAYYRLKQTDSNGHQTFSTIIYIENTAKNSEMTVFPNPILRGSLLNIQLNNTTPSDDIKVEIFNANGQIVAQQRGFAPIQTDNWVNSVYFVKIVNNVKITTFKVFKQ
jgi:hypothetical protein